MKAKRNIKNITYKVWFKKTFSYNQAIIWQNEKEGVSLPILTNN